jgi:hypothetical protein
MPDAPAAAGGGEDAAAAGAGAKKSRYNATLKKTLQQLQEQQTRLAEEQEQHMWAVERHKVRAGAAAVACVGLLVDCAHNTASSAAH